MRPLSHRFFALAALVLLIFILGFSSPQPAGAQPGSPYQQIWLPFGEDTLQGPPSVRLVSASDVEITLEADMAGVFVETVKAGGQVYSRFSGDGYGYPAKVGLPSLPVFRAEVEIPYGAEVSLEILSENIEEHTLDKLGLHPVYPLQPSAVKLPGAQENQPFEADPGFYQSGRLYPAEPATMAESYVVRGHRVQVVEIWPVAYEPVNGGLTLHSSLSIRLELTGSQVDETRSLASRYRSPVFDEMLSRKLLNYDQGQVTVQSVEREEVGYLVVTADEYYPGIQPFVALLNNRGFQVTVTKLSQISSVITPEVIKAYIQTAYDTWSVPPSYLLLVGDTDKIPAWRSEAQYASGHSTDLYYTTVDGLDYVPDLYRGRFPVRSADQLTAVVNKYISYENLSGVEAWLDKAAFIATCDEDYYTVAESSHNYAINTHTLPAGFTGMFPNNPQPGGDKIFCISYGGTPTNIRNAANNGRFVLIYSGHGTETAWADIPSITFNQTDVRSLTGTGFFPFVASHACLTGSFASTYNEESFGETWVLQENKGALAFWGSSHNTYWDQDDVLERTTFDALFSDSAAPPTVGMVTNAALAKVQATYPSWGKYYWEAYNLLGDPSVQLLLNPKIPSFSLSAKPTSGEICATGQVKSNLQISSLLGYDQVVSLMAGPLPPGVSSRFSPASAAAPFISELALQVNPGTASGDYSLIITGFDHSGLVDETHFQLNIVGGLPDAPVQQQPADGAVDVPVLPTFDWDGVAETDAYAFQLDRNPLFFKPVLDLRGLSRTTYQAVEPLEGGACYWWRTSGMNFCGGGEWSEPFHFATEVRGDTFEDDIESGDELWDHTTAVGFDNWQITSTDYHSPSHAWFVPDVSRVTDSSLVMTQTVPVIANARLSFWHSYGFEADDYKGFDGSVLEASIDGSNWVDLGDAIFSGGYDMVINEYNGNPLGGRMAWTGDSDGWKEVEVDLSAYAGKNIWLRWRLGCDANNGGTGWWIDDVRVDAPLPAGPAPLLTSVEDTTAEGDWYTTLTIHGANFRGLPSLRLGETWLHAVILVDSKTLRATIPSGVALGTYDLTLYNGDCQEATLSSAYKVTHVQWPIFFPMIRKGMGVTE